MLKSKMLSNLITCQCEAHDLIPLHHWRARLYHCLADLDPDALRQGLEPQLGASGASFKVPED